MNPVHVAAAWSFFVAGVLLGVTHYLGLYANTRLYLRRGPICFAAGLHALRVILTCAILAFIAQFGATPLLVAFAGFLVGRPAVRHFVVRAR